LTVLIVGSCTQLTDDGIKAVAETKIGKNLSTLSYSLCSGCTDAAFQAVVQHCPNLESLGAAGTGVKQIPETIGQDLPKLNKLWLHKNDIKIIPTSITLLLNNKLQFLIYDNPIEDPPPNIVKEGMESICVWLYRKRKMCKLLRKVTNEHKGKSTSVALFRPWGSEKALLYNLTKKEEQKNLERLNSTGTVIDAVTK
jgi:Leucine-rich repeat (LRR) protein